MTTMRVQTALRRAAQSNAVLGLAACLPLLWLYRGWVNSSALPASGEVTSRFAVWMHIATHMLFGEDAFPLWNRFANGGEPLFASPQVGILSPGTALSAVFGTALGIKLDMLFHVVLMCAGTAALARALGASKALALLCAVLACTNPYFVSHMHLGHLHFLFSMAWMPWVWLCLYRSMRPHEPRWRVFAAAAGLMLAAQVWEGAESPLLYGVAGLGLFGAVWLMSHRNADSRWRVLQVGAAVTLVGVACAWVRLGPLAEALALVPIEHREGWQPVGAVATRPGPAIHSLATALTLGAWFAPRRKRFMTVIATAWLAVGHALAYRPAAFAFFQDHAPAVELQPYAGHAHILVTWAVPVMWALAGTAAARTHRPRVMRGLLALAALAVILQVRGMEPAPAVSDVRSQTEANAFMKEVARVAGDDRLYLMGEETSPGGAPHITVPLGVETVTNAALMAVSDGTRPPTARALGLLSARWVGSAQPLVMAGLQLRHQAPVCPPPNCQPPVSAGPFLYENTVSLPRMFTAEAAVLFVGSGPHADQVFNALLHSDAWDPRRVVLLQTHAPTPQQVDHAALVIRHDSVAWPAALGLGHVPVLDVAGTVLPPHVAAAVAEVGTGAPAVAPVSPLRDGQLYRGCFSAGSLLVTTSSFAHTPGWQAVHDATQPLPLWRANGAGTATPLQHGAPCVQFSYRPHSVLWGGAVTLTGVSGVVLLVLLAMRRRQWRLSGR